MNDTERTCLTKWLNLRKQNIIGIPTINVRFVRGEIQSMISLPLDGGGLGQWWMALLYTLPPGSLPSREGREYSTIKIKACVRVRNSRLIET
jgi:hypothetical protein